MILVAEAGPTGAPTCAAATAMRCLRKSPAPSLWTGAISCGAGDGGMAQQATCCGSPKAGLLRPATTHTSTCEALP